MLEAGLRITFISDLWEGNQKQKLENSLQKNIDLSLDQMIATTPEKLLKTLKKHSFSYSNLEKLADLLMKIGQVEKGNQPQLAQKALHIYRVILKESDTYYFDITEKIEEANTYLDT